MLLPRHKPPHEIEVNNLLRVGAAGIAVSQVNNLFCPVASFLLQLPAGGCNRIRLTVINLAGGYFQYNTAAGVSVLLFHYYSAVFREGHHSNCTVVFHDFPVGFTFNCSNLVPSNVENRPLVYSLGAYLFFFKNHFFSFSAVISLDLSTAA